MSKKICTGGTGGRLGDRFAEHLCDIERNERDASKPVDRHWNLPNHSKQHLEVCGLPIHQDSSESYILLEQKFIFQIGTMNPHSINERFSFSQYILFFNSSFSRRRFPTLFSVYKHTHNSQFLYSLWRRANAWNVSFEILYGVQVKSVDKNQNYLIMMIT